MMSSNTDLFVYGTLAFDRVLHALLGHVPSKEPMLVKGYVARTIHLDGWAPFPVILTSSEHTVPGFVLKNLSEIDMVKLDRYEFVHSGFYVRKYISIKNAENVSFYEPAENLFKVGRLGEVWDVKTLDPLLESLYVDSVVPEFKLENPDLFR
jgi:hypothetical protein